MEKEEVKVVGVRKLKKLVLEILELLKRVRVRRMLKVRVDLG